MSAVIALSKEIKLVYSYIKFNFVNTIMSHLDQYTHHMTYIIVKGIIKVTIGKLLWEFEDVQGQTYDNIMCVITFNTNTSSYSTTAKIPMAYHLEIKYFGISISLLQKVLVL